MSRTFAETLASCALRDTTLELLRIDETAVMEEQEKQLKNINIGPMERKLYQKKYDTAKEMIEYITEAKKIRRKYA